MKALIKARLFIAFARKADGFYEKLRDILADPNPYDSRIDWLQHLADVKYHRLTKTI
jgi:hypothetical protein